MACRDSSGIISLHNPLIRVTRRILPPEAYPGTMRRALHPELEALGPAEYDVERLELAEYPGQGACSGRAYRAHFTQPTILSRTVSLLDLREIGNRGANFFQEHFPGKELLAIRSEIEGSSSRYGATSATHVPRLRLVQQKLWLDWYEISDLLAAPNIVVPLFPAELLVA